MIQRDMPRPGTPPTPYGKPKPKKSAMKRKPQKRIPNQAGSNLPSASLHVVTNSRLAGSAPSGPTEEPEYFTPDEAAHWLKVHPATLRRWEKTDPSLPVTRVNGTVRFRRDALVRWLRSHEAGQAVPRSSRHVLAFRNSALTRETAADGGAVC
jgi:excisionase family DNA binding protein